MTDTHFMLDDATHRRLPEADEGPDRAPLISAVTGYRPAGGLLSSADDLLPYRGQCVAPVRFVDVIEPSAR